METIEAISRRIRTAEDLRSVVRTMKGLAAVSIRQYERAVASLENYNHAVEMGLQIVLRHEDTVMRPRATHRDGRVAALVFGSDQGLCGPLNRQVVEHAISELDGVARGGKAQIGALIAVGSRAAMELEMSGRRPEHVIHLPSSVAGITERVQDVLLQLDAWRAAQHVERVLLFHQRTERGRAWRPATVQVLPVDTAWLDTLRRRPWPTRNTPTFTMPPAALLSDLIQQHLFGVLYRAFAESLASENAARLAAMQAAEKNIDERWQQLKALFHQQRQAVITEELLDVVSGFETMRHNKR
ncbi:MAG: F0F1 ATP synthase subunit gamma [Phycisphaera sp.]|nr:F0F1 ATP synthase subunit gamma [Phycisphaera sp.]